MSFPYTPRMQDVKIESLETQLDYLNLLRLRHLQWMSAADDPEVKEIHSKIARGLDEITGSYGSLLKVGKESANLRQSSRTVLKIRED